MYLVGLVLMVALPSALPLGSWLVVSTEMADPGALLVLGSHEDERLPHAAALALRWPAASVLLTQPVTPTQYNCQDCANRAQTLAAAGVTPDRIVLLEPRVRNTYDELVAAGQWAVRAQRRRLLVVTSPYHGRRVMLLAPAAAPGVDVGVSPARVEGGLAWPWWSRRYDRRYVVYEWGALLDNSWRHGLGPRHWLESSRSHAIVDVPSH